MKLMILAAAMALSAPALADHEHDQAQLTACELVVTLDNVAEEASELSTIAAARRRGADAKALSNLADSAETLADKVDRLILSPLERDATFAYARAQLSRLRTDFELVKADADDVRKKSRYLEAELEYAGALHQELKEILSQPDRAKGSRNHVASL